MLLRVHTVCLLVLNIFPVIQCSHGDLENYLHHYDTLHQSDITIHHHVTKRRTGSDLYYHDKIISFDTLGRYFKLHLSSCRHLFTQDFKAYAVRPGIGGSLYEDIPLETQQFYEGYIDNDTDSSVSAYWEDGNLMAKIKTKKEMFVIEPSWRHLPRSKKHGMLTYRGSDIKSAAERDPLHHVESGFCGYMRAGVDTSIGLHNPVIDENELPQSSQTHDKSAHGRNKRQTSSSKVCTVALVADHRFTQNVGDGSLSVTAKYLAGVLSGITTNIYEKSDFGNGYAGVGFEIKGIVIYSQASTSPEFNTDKAWGTQPLLESFGKQNWGDYCLAHLFTYQAFTGGVQGLGWIASSASNEVGGICSPVYGGKYYNTAWTSHENSGGGRILALEADLVTAHEFGHNWGSPHDPSGCTPGVGSGGKHLMYQYAVSGYDPNNDLFSDCSLSSIGSVLQSKAPACFVSPSGSFCGNYNVEDTEECDGGAQGSQGLDPCCTNQCRLASTAVCSDANDACCSGCQFMSVSVECRALSTRTCEDAAFCTPSSGQCPASKPMQEGSECADKGTCTDAGVCQALCESNNLISCSCDQEVVAACQYCCKTSADATCTPYLDGSGVSHNLPDGRTCYLGYCETGSCVVSTTDTTARLWDVIKNFNINAILKWMKNNIVLTTIVLSLVLYIPLCLIIFCIDRRNAKKDEKERAWLDKDNDKLVMDGDDKHIRRTHRRTRQPGGAYSRMENPPSEASISNVDYQPRYL